MGESFVLLKGVFNYCEDKECGLGNLVADAMVWKSMVNQGSRGWSDVGVAMINGGAIRSSLNTGKHSHHIYIMFFYNRIPYTVHDLGTLVLN